MSEPPSTIVFVAVDGVISVDEPTWWPRETWRSESIHRLAAGTTVNVTWSSGVTDGLRQVEALLGVEMRWLTNWNLDALFSLAPAIGLGCTWILNPTGDNLPVAPDWWKAQEVRDGMSEFDRVVWIDADITTWLGAVRRSGNRDLVSWMDPQRLLSVCPFAPRGLEPHNIAAIERFIVTGERPVAE